MSMILSYPDTASTSSSHAQSYLYELIGVTVHTGTADGGHYYSFIQDRVHRDQEDDRWFMFNDAEVKPFDPKQLPAECYGGEMTVSTLIFRDLREDFSDRVNFESYMYCTGDGKFAPRLIFEMSINRVPSQPEN